MVTRSRIGRFTPRDAICALDGEPTYAVLVSSSRVDNTANAWSEYEAVSSTSRDLSSRGVCRLQGWSGRDTRRVSHSAGAHKAGSFGIEYPNHVAPGFEADDVIGTLARQATAQKVIPTLLQVIQTRSARGRLCERLLAQPYGRSQEPKRTIMRRCERYKGLQPSQLADLPPQRGYSDNIPGVKGIGETGSHSAPQSVRLSGGYL